MNFRTWRMLFFFCIAGLVVAVPGVCRPAGKAPDRDMPISGSAQWRQGVAHLERYRQGGTPPPPLRVNAFDSPSPSRARSTSRVFPPASPAFAPVRAAPDWRGIIRRASLRHGIEEALLTAVLQVESNFNSLAVSHKGARGAMQIMPETGKELGLTDFFDPVANTDAGARYLAAMLRAFVRLDLSLAAYNAGPAAVRQHGGRVPPYEETRNYVARVLAAYHRLNAQRPK